MENTIQRIHTDFSFDLMELVRQSNDITNLQRIKPALVSDSTFTERVEYYRQTYPTFNFVTERQIEDICRKYGLFFGSLLTFSGRIPVKNRLEIDAFNLLPRDVMFTDNDLPGRIFRTFTHSRNVMSASVNVPSTNDHRQGFVEVRTGYQPANPDLPFEVIPVGEHFVLLREPDERSYRIFLEMDIHGSPWFIEFGTGTIDSGQIAFAWRQSFGGFAPVFDDVLPTRESMRPNTRPFQTVKIVNHFAEVTLRLTFQNIQRANRLSLVHNVSPMVVADRSMFGKFGDAVETVGHRIRFKQSQAVNNMTFSFVDDPIILQPVPFGYLVVTKWGMESTIPTFQSPQSN